MEANTRMCINDASECACVSFWFSLSENSNVYAYFFYYLYSYLLCLQIIPPNNFIFDTRLSKWTKKKDSGNRLTLNELMINTRSRRTNEKNLLTVAHKVRCWFCVSFHRMLLICIFRMKMKTYKKPSIFSLFKCEAHGLARIH